MGCNCGQRRDLHKQMLNNLRKGDTAAVRQNAQRYAQTIRQDLRKLVRSPLTVRPPTR